LHKDPPQRGPFGLAELKLKPGAVPKRQRGFTTQGEKAEGLNALVKEFVERGWIEPSYSEWSSAAFVVPKKEPGTWRMVVDYRYLNSMICHDAYQLPLIEPLLQKHSRAKVLTVIDMKKGYHQMPLRKDPRHLTAMQTPSGLWQWRVMPMGVKIGNAAFQRMMEWVLRDLPFADAFVDDIIVSSEADTYEEAVAKHKEDLMVVLGRLRENKLVCDLSKAQLFVDYVEFCGHLVGQGTRRPSTRKLECVARWRRPETVTDLRSFIGFANWYHDYIPHFASHAAPIMGMFKVPKGEGKKGSKKRLVWTEETIQSFERVKAELQEKLELVSVQPDLPFILTTDTSDFAVGAVLTNPRNMGKRDPSAFGQESAPRDSAGVGVLGKRRHMP
jgi:hypothetical protein